MGEPAQVDVVVALVGQGGLAERGVTAFALELLPRTTRAQSMDALSSMATVAGYRAVLLAARKLPRMFPMMMTAAGTIAPAQVLIVGAGAAGLWAAAECARRVVPAGGSVLVLEKTRRTGTKVLASGGTRCNLTTTLGPDDAARLFMSVGILFDDADLTPDALFQAASAFSKLGQDEQKTKVESELKERYPDSAWVEKLGNP